MFEDATFDARGAVRDYASRWMMLTATANVALVAALIVTPLLVTRSLVLSTSMLKAPIYTPRPEPVRIPEQIVQPSLARTVIAIPMVHTAGQIHVRTQDVGPEPSNGPWNPISIGSGEGSGIGGPDAISVFRGHSPQVRPGTPSMARVSSGVVEGLLLPHVTPSYPVIAHSMGISGAVVLAAVISTDGRVENLHVISGHPLLQEAAMGAVKDWRYKPYLLNGKAVEVETTITIRFSLNGR